MLKNTLILVLIVSIVEGDFDFKLKYCRLRCGCGYAEKEKNDSPTGYYWRDFYGTIPTDAFPIGDENQYPQTYVGFVFDPVNNGTYTTTIIDGLDYVYNAVDGQVFKKTSVIQILCTREPERLVFKTLTADNASSVSVDYDFVTAAAHRGDLRGTLRLRTFFVVKVSKCKVAYASDTISIKEELEFAAMDGTLQKSSEKMFLLYKKNKTDEETNKPFISHKYKYSIRGGSIIPSFYKELNIGSCSVICTNEKKDETKNKHADPMEYYWKPRTIFDPNEGVLVGLASRNKSAFVGQAYTALNWFDVGELDGTSVVIGSEQGGVVEGIDTRVLGSKQKSKFEWVSTSNDEFPSLDRSKMIPGGELDNGTMTVVGRELTPFVKATSIHLLNSGAHSFSMFGSYDKFDVLMIKDDK